MGRPFPGVGKPPGLLYAKPMLTKVAIILVCLVLLFGFGRWGKPQSRSRSKSVENTDKSRPSLVTPTNILLAVIAVLLVLTLVTTWVKS